MPTDLKSPASDADSDGSGRRYAFKASLIGSAHEFELTNRGLSWKISGRSDVWAYRDIAAIRLSYRPSSMQAHRFRADIWNKNGGRLRVISTNWQTVSLMTPQDNGYRAFIEGLHARMRAAGSTATLTGGLPRGLYAAALAFVALLVLAMIGLLIRALVTGEYAGAGFLVAFALLFNWQIGGFMRRNKPVAYTFDEIPKALLP
ncbi:MAG: hypothetical protein DI543_14125 [Bradyrhizobium icense]|nr:MAG: hypothetical protein DI543_14125 [Bradyrhizobium icense]